MDFSGEVARQYARHRRGFPAPVVDALVDALELPAEAYVLDLGCGTGQLTVPLAERYGRVVGADPSPDMLALARAGAPGRPLRPRGTTAGAGRTAAARRSDPGPTPGAVVAPPARRGNDGRP